MKKITVFAGTIVMFAGLYALAQGIDAAGKGAAVKTQQALSTPTQGCWAGCGMRFGAKGRGSSATSGSQAMMQRCMNMMQKAGMTQAMMRRCQVMMNTPIFMDSPCAVYGQAQALNLSDVQKKRLIKIENQARQQALAVLTSEQRKKMGDLPDKPMAMAQMWQQMCPRMMPMMQKRMGGNGKGAPTMMCPMMGMMRGGNTSEGSSAKSQGSGSKSAKQ